MRLDAAMVARGIAPSRERAKECISAGDVFVDGSRAKKASASISENAHIEYRGDVLPFVSRGGLKLQRAIQEFDIELDGATCMDIGASTGGFTDCMLQSGALRVFAIDVGHDQLHASLREDARVVNLEGMNIRDLTAADIENELVDFASVDVSFISLSHVLPVAAKLLVPGGQMACLVKPQFEAGKEKLGKKGVVRSRHTHYDVLVQVTQIAVANGFSVLGLTYSPVKGPEGNIEYLMHIKKTQGEPEPFAFDFDGLIDQAWAQLS